MPVAVETEKASGTADPAVRLRLSTGMSATVAGGGVAGAAATTMIATLLVL